MICGEQAEIEDWQATPGCVSLGQKHTYCIVLPPTHKAPSTSDVVYFSAAKQGNGRFRPQIWMNFRKNSKTAFGSVPKNLWNHLSRVYAIE